LNRDCVGARNARPQIRLSEYGIIVNKSIQEIPVHYPQIIVDKYIIMPNHIHMILKLSGNKDGRAMPAPTISTVINQLKGAITKQIGFSMWQKLFHDRIIRDEIEYQNKLNYIEENPARWAEDEYYGGK